MKMTSILRRQAMKKTSILAKTRLFAFLDLDQLKEVVELAEEKRFGKDETIFSQGEQAKTLYLLLEGGVVLKRMGIEDLDPMAETLDQKGDVFGMAALSKSHIYNVTAKTTGETRVLSLDSERLRAIVRQNPHTGMEVFSELAQLYLNRLNSARAAISNMFAVSRAQHTSPVYGLYQELE